MRTATLLILALEVVSCWGMALDIEPQRVQKICGRDRLSSLGKIGSIVDHGQSGNIDIYAVYRNV